MRQTFSVIALSLAAVFAASAPAGAQSTKDRVEILEAEVAQLRAAAQSSITQAQRIVRLEAEVRTLTGRLEEASYALDEANQKIAAMSAILSGESGVGDGAFGDDGLGLSGPVDLTGAGSDPIADQLGGAVGAAGTADAAGAAGSLGVTLPFEPEAAFAYANDFLLRGDYTRAQASFELFLETFPRHARAADAKFRLGEIYLTTGQNAAAAETFMEYIQAHPNDPRAAEGYVKLGSAFGRLNQTAEACNVLRVMKGKFPNASPDVIDRANREMARNRC